MSIIMLLLHISTLLCIFRQLVVSNLLSYINMSIQTLVIQFKISHMFKTQLDTHSDTLQAGSAQRQHSTLRMYIRPPFSTYYKL